MWNRSLFCVLGKAMHNDLTAWRLTLTFIQAKVQPVEMNSYNNYLQFDLCNCSSLCKLPIEERPEIDIGKYVDYWTRYEIALPYIILGFLLLIILYAVVESFVGQLISMQRFILGPEIERDDPTISNPG